MINVNAVTKVLSIVVQVIQFVVVPVINTIVAGLGRIRGLGARNK